MEFLQSILPIIIYLLLIVILIVGIILFLRIIKTLDKVDKVVEDVNHKVKSLNGFFEIIDYTTDKLVNVSDKLVDFISLGITKVLDFRKTKKKSEKKEEKGGEKE